MTTHADNLWSLSLSQGLSALKTLAQGQILSHFRQPDNNFYIVQKGKYLIGNSVPVTRVCARIGKVVEVVTDIRRKSE